MPCPRPFKTSQGRGGDIFWATPSKLGKVFLFSVDLQLILLSLLDICDYIEFEKNEKAFLSICSELLALTIGLKIDFLAEKVSMN